MPYNPLTGIFQRVWKFVDQYEANAEVTRSALDVALDDLMGGVNAAMSVAMNLVGEWNATTPFPVHRPDGFTKIRERDAFMVSVAGTRDGVDFAVGDYLVALKPAPGPTYSNCWLKAPSHASTLGLLNGAIAAVSTVETQAEIATTQAEIALHLAQEAEDSASRANTSASDALASKTAAEAARVVAETVLDAAEVVLTGAPVIAAALPEAEAARAGAEAARTGAEAARDAALAAQAGIEGGLSLGVDQTWQDVSSDRLDGSTYQNTTGRAICVYANFEDAPAEGVGVELYLQVSPTLPWPEHPFSPVTKSARIFFSEVGGIAAVWVETIVPPGHYYRVFGNITKWLELR